MRLTLLYASLFLVSGIALLTITLFLVFRSPVLVTFTSAAPPPAPRVDGTTSQPILPRLPSLDTRPVSPTWGTIRALAFESAVGLAVMAVVSNVLGWVMAGRALSPLRTMTAKTRSISERNLHERLALTGPRDEVTELADTVDGLLTRLEQAFEAQRRFVANASHELRTPLAMMRTSVDVAVSKPRPVAREVTVLADKLREGLDAADRLLEGLLLLARAQTNGHQPREAVALAGLATSALDARSEAIAAKNLSVDDLTSDMVVQGSPVLLTSLVENLVDNAVRHNEHGGWLRITADGSRLIVENSGAVLDQEEVDLLGQPFQRLGAERTARPGTGLGLSIVAAIAAAHGGRLVLAARPEGGLRAEVTL